MNAWCRGFRTRIALSLLALAGLGSAGAASGQQGALAGTVRDSASGQPLSSVLVEVLAAAGTPVAAATTGAEGGFRVVELEPATYAVRFTVPGWETRTVQGQTVEGGRTTSLVVEMVERSYNLNPITVTASRTEEKVLDAPAAVQVRSTRDIEEEPAITVADHVKGMAGVDIITTGLQSQYIVARGFNNIFSGAMLTMTDNRIARVPSLRANINYMNPTTNLDLERVEVVLGPGSALYGPNAANGVLHSITKSSIDYPGATLSVAGGLRQQDAGQAFAGNDEGIFQAEGRAAWAAGEDFGVKVSGTYFQGQEWRFVDPVEAAQQDAAQACLEDFDPSRSACANFAEGLDPQDPEDRALLLESVRNVARGRNNDLERWALDVRADWRPSASTALIFSGGRTQAVSGIDLTGLGAGQVVDWGYNYLQGRLVHEDLFAQVFFNKSDNEDTYLLRSGRPLIDRSSLLVGQVQHSTRLGERQNFIYGLDLLRTVPQTDSTINGQNEPDDEITEFGGYVQSETTLSDRLDLVLAARLDHHSILDDVVFSPRTALVYRPNQENSFRLTYNRAFSTPTTLNLFLDISGGSVPLPFGLGRYDIRAQGVTADGLSFRRTGGVPMHMTPFAGGPQEFFPTTTAQLWTEMVAAAGILAQNGVLPPQLAGLLGQLPVPNEQQVGLVAIPLDPAAVGSDTGEPFDPRNAVDLSGIGDIPVLDPTITNTFEVGYKGLLGEALSLSVNAWYSIVDDFVSALRVNSPNVFLEGASLVGYLTANFEALVGQAFPDTATARATAQQVGSQLAAIPLGVVTAEDVGGTEPALFLTYRNLGDVDLFGGDLSATYLIDDRWQIGGAVSVVNKDEFAPEDVPDPTVAGDTVPLNAPTFKLAASIGYRADEHGWNGRLSFRHQSGFDANSGVYIGRVEEYQVFDLNVGYRFRDLQGLELQLDVQNLFDADYRTFVGAPELGRFALLRARYDFSPF